MKNPTVFLGCPFFLGGENGGEREETAYRKELGEVMWKYQ